MSRFLAENHSVAIMSRPPSFDLQETGDRLHLSKGDIRIFSDVLRAVREPGIERIVHVAYTLTAEGEANPQVNALRTGNVFEAARRYQSGVGSVARP